MPEDYNLPFYFSCLDNCAVLAGGGGSWSG